MSKNRKSNLFSDLNVGLSSFVSAPTPSAEDLVKAKRLRDEAARLRSYTAAIREMKAAGFTQEKVIAELRQRGGTLPPKRVDPRFFGTEKKQINVLYGAHNFENKTSTDPKKDFEP